MDMCNCNNNAVGGISFPGFTRYACCNPCCDGSVSAERVEADTDNTCGCCCGCCCCRCCGCNNGNVGGASDNNFRCPCRGGW